MCYTNRLCYICATLKTYPILIIVGTDAILCVIFFICFCSACTVHFLLVNIYARFTVFVSQNLHRAYERFIYFVKNGCAATG